MKTSVPNKAILPPNCFDNFYTIINPAMSSLPACPPSRCAVIQDAERKPELAKISNPALTPGTLLIKTLAVTLDPSDYKMGAASATPRAVIGSNFTGIVAAIASDTETDLVLGDTVAVGSYGSNPGSLDNGSFATYIRAPASLTMRLAPMAKLASEQAAPLATALATCALAY